ncbi:hypothetical protein LEP1GSC186_1166 [Leptospira noguchii serovar Autumnalis str. ZUN142]|uniref:Uncharacterized protein n=1 Tax=Leptospira noguchii serovar Autumnalis str. ZUN142 TaxID=1085540 RepID=M6U321_9LEPT|nr:hypothetical protein LEP1GSC186_1166 [Leptospira noguchii serovar Autumnalis str. ZUN142]
MRYSINFFLSSPYLSSSSGTHDKAISSNVLFFILLLSIQLRAGLKTVCTFES